MIGLVSAPPHQRAGQSEKKVMGAKNRKVPPPRKTHTGLWIILMVFLFAEALLYAWCRVQCVNAGYGIDHEMRRQEALLKQCNSLNIEMARLKSPERIEAIARTRLGLVMPDSHQRVMLP
ncbi:cell division protein FtsL [Desulfosarcina variabilis]|uniref:cell division protein FtsL n=1 Tax=Desulfosarcina variabilis TaxID=2300 RepID=UPI003AFA151B